MANAFSMMGDKLVNVLAQLGTGRDKASHSQLIFRPMSDLELSNAYRSAWLPKKIINIPALDCVREWREWQAEDDQISALAEVEKRLNIPEKLLKALKMARLYGKSYILIGTTDTDLSQELVLDRMGADSLQYVTVLKKSELIASEREEDIGLPNYGQPKWYTIARDGVTRIHPSRLVILLGSEILDSDLEWEPGAGDSVLNTVMEAVMRAEGTDANVASLIFEAKIDIIGIPNLSKYISTAAGESALASRLTTVASMKGVNGTLVKDSEETYDQKQATFATLPEIMQAFYGVVAGASDIPVTRLMGRSAAGMNATGEGDLTNYYDMIKSIQTLELTPAMFVLDEMIIRSALGSRPKEVFVEWAPLWQVSEKERAEIGKITVETGAALHATGLVNPDVLAKSVTNALIEQGVFPGLEVAIDEFGIEPDEEDEAEAIAAAEGLAERVQGGEVEAPQGNPPANAQDAAPGPDSEDE